MTEPIRALTMLVQRVGHKQPWGLPTSAMGDNARLTTHSPMLSDRFGPPSHSAARYARSADRRRAAARSRACTWVRSRVVDRHGPRCCTRPATRRGVTFTRSALKPLQALPFVAGGGVERFGYSSSRRSRCCCASHSGEPRARRRGRRHARPRRQYAGRTAVRHPRAHLFRPARRRAAAACRTRRWRITVPASTAACWLIAFNAATQNTTISPSTTRCSRRSAARWRASRRRRRTGLVAGIDGCSAPNYAVPLSALALAFARLAAAEVDADYGRRLRRSGRRNERRIRKWFRASAATTLR